MLLNNNSLLTTPAYSPPSPTYTHTCGTASGLRASSLCLDKHPGDAPSEVSARPRGKQAGKPNSLQAALLTRSVREPALLARRLLLCHSVWTGQAGRERARSRTDRVLCQGCPLPATRPETGRSKDYSRNALRRPTGRTQRPRARRALSTHAAPAQDGPSSRAPAVPRLLLLIIAPAAASPLLPAASWPQA